VIEYWQALLGEIRAEAVLDPEFAAAWHQAVRHQADRTTAQLAGGYLRAEHLGHGEFGVVEGIESGAAIPGPDGMSEEEVLGAFQLAVLEVARERLKAMGVTLKLTVDSTDLP
jgi:hypothetical protein